MLWGSPAALGEPSRVLKDGQEFARQSRSKNRTGWPEAHWELPSWPSPPPPRTPRAGPCPQECILRAPQATSMGQALAGRLCQKTRERQGGGEERRRRGRGAGGACRAQAPSDLGPGSASTPCGGPRRPGLRCCSLSLCGWLCDRGRSPACGLPHHLPQGPGLRLLPQFPLSGETGQPPPEARARDKRNPEPVRLAQRYRHCHLCCHWPQQLRAAATWTQTRCWGTWRASAPHPDTRLAAAPRMGRRWEPAGSVSRRLGQGCGGCHPSTGVLGPSLTQGPRGHPDCGTPGQTQPVFGGQGAPVRMEPALNRRPRIKCASWTESGPQAEPQGRRTAGSPRGGQAHQANGEAGEGAGGRTAAQAEPHSEEPAGDPGRSGLSPGPGNGGGASPNRAWAPPTRDWAVKRGHRTESEGVTSQEERSLVPPQRQSHRAPGRLKRGSARGSRGSLPGRGLLAAAELPLGAPGPRSALWELTAGAVAGLTPAALTPLSARMCLEYRIRELYCFRTEKLETHHPERRSLDLSVGTDGCCCPEDAGDTHVHLSLVNHVEVVPFVPCEGGKTET